VPAAGTRLEFCLILVKLALAAQRRASQRMPTYEYTCEKCRKNFEAYQSMRDEAYRVCPKELCRQARWGKGKVRRLLGAGAGLIFKGSGFYTTDYRSQSYKEAAKKESSSGKEKSGGESAGSKTESKPAPATAAAKTPEPKAKKD